MIKYCLITLKLYLLLMGGIVLELIIATFYYLSYPSFKNIMYTKEIGILLKGLHFQTLIF
jgi:hypothetical protein